MTREPTKPLQPQRGDNVHWALAKVQAEIKNPARTAEAKATEHRTYKYTPLPDITDLVRPLFDKYNLSYTQVLSPSTHSSVVVVEHVVETLENGTTVQTDTTDNVIEYCLLTTLHHWPSNTEVTSIYPVRPVKRTPQGFGSALTYARRYALCALVGIAPAEEDEEATEHEARPQRSAPAGPPTRAVPAPQRMDASDKGRLLARVASFTEHGEEFLKWALQTLYLGPDAAFSYKAITKTQVAELEAILSNDNRRAAALERYMQFLAKTSGTPAQAEL